MAEAELTPEKQKPIEKFRELDFKDFDERIARYAGVSILKGWELTVIPPKEEAGGDTFSFTKTSENGVRFTIHINTGNRGSVLIRRWPEDSSNERYERGRLRFSGIRNFELADHGIDFNNGKESLTVSNSHFSILPQDQRASPNPRFYLDVYFQ